MAKGWQAEDSLEVLPVVMSDWNVVGHCKWWLYIQIHFDLRRSFVQRLIASMGVLSENPDLLERVFATKEYNPQGVYGLQLCVDGVWEDIVIDDRLPCDQNNRLVFSRVSVSLECRFSCKLIYKQPLYNNL